ncbi:MAG TPA: type II secretion system F family protein, partial [Gemmatimonadaceae bacterium]|nr:type II secretion system F family protein [Gemmatimonadaceae bacterium]
MPTYAYQAVSGSGERLRGQEHAASPGALSRTLEDRGLLVLEVAESDDATTAGGGFFKFGRRREVLEVTRAMAALLPVGMPLAQALNAASGVATGNVRSALNEVRLRVERGETLSAALGAYPQLFSPLYIGLVRAGEKSGDVDSAFARLAETLEREEQLRGRVLSASIYPLLLACAGTVAVTVLLFFVLPRFVGLLAGSGARLPASTQFLLSVSTALHRYWPALLIAPLMVAGLVAWSRNTVEGRRALAKLMLAVPLVRTLRSYALAARFSRLVGVLLGGGAPLLTALDDTVESIGDPVARDDAMGIRTRVREGSSLKAAIGQSAIYPALLAQL